MTGKVCRRRNSLRNVTINFAILVTSSLFIGVDSFQIGSNGRNSPRADTPKPIVKSPSQSTAYQKQFPVSTPASSDTEFTSYGHTPDWGIYSRGVNDGLLSPRTVQRLTYNCDVSTSRAVHSFLQTYESEGPMACLPYLSDPDILPELTRAMRDSLANI